MSVREHRRPPHIPPPVACALVAALLGTAPGCGAGDAGGETVAVQLGDVPVECVEDGDLAALESLTVCSRLRGQIEFIAKDLEKIEKDAILVELDKTEFERELKDAQTELEAAEKRLVENQKNLVVERGQLDVDLERKRASLRLAEVRHQTVLAGALASDLSIAGKNLDACLTALRIADDGLRDSLALAERGFATEFELDEKRLARERAFVASEKARMRIDDLRSFPTAAQLRPVELALQEAKLDLAIAEQQAASRASELAQSIEWDRAEVSRCQERIRRAADNLAACTVRAPRAGLVVRVKGPWDAQKIDVGGRVWPGIAIVELPDLSRMKAKVQIPESMVRHFAVGDAVTVIVDLGENARGRGSDRTVLPGRIRWIDTWARDKNASLAPADQKREGLSGIRVFSTEVELDGSDERLRMGTRAQVRFAAVLHGVLSVDRRALVSEDGMHYLRRRSANGTTDLVRVTVTDATEARAVIEGDVAEGDRVCVGPPSARSRAARE